MGRIVINRFAGQIVCNGEHGIGEINGRRILSMGCVKPANDDEAFYERQKERENNLALYRFGKMLDLGGRR